MSDVRFMGFKHNAGFLTYPNRFDKVYKDPKGFSVLHNTKGFRAHHVHGKVYTITSWIINSKIKGYTAQNPVFRVKAPIERF